MKDMNHGSDCFSQYIEYITIYLAYFLKAFPKTRLLLSFFRSRCNFISLKNNA